MSSACGGAGEVFHLGFLLHARALRQDWEPMLGKCTWLKRRCTKRERVQALNLWPLRAHATVQGRLGSVVHVCQPHRPVELLLRLLTFVHGPSSAHVKMGARTYQKLKLAQKNPLTPSAGSTLLPLGRIGVGMAQCLRKAFLMSGSHWHFEPKHLSGTRAHQCWPKCDLSRAHVCAAGAFYQDHGSATTVLDTRL